MVWCICLVSVGVGCLAFSGALWLDLIGLVGLCWRVLVGCECVGGLTCFGCLLDGLC